MNNFTLGFGGRLLPHREEKLLYSEGKDKQLSHNSILLG